MWQKLHELMRRRNTGNATGTKTIYDCCTIPGLARKDLVPALIGAGSAGSADLWSEKVGRLSRSLRHHPPFKPPEPLYQARIPSRFQRGLRASCIPQKPHSAPVSGSGGPSVPDQLGV